MPVLLDAIPEKAEKPARPESRRWVLFLLMMMSGGAALTFWRWPTAYSGFVFWFTALGLPFCLWGFVFSLRRFAYKAGQVGALSRNRAREQLIEREVLRGQRCAWILGAYMQSPAGHYPGALLDAMAQGATITEMVTPRGSVQPLRYAALKDFHHDLPEQLRVSVLQVMTRIQAVMEDLPRRLPCWLILDCDDDLYASVEEQLKRELPEMTDRAFHLMSGKGLGAFDGWLDSRWKTPGVLVVVTLSLPATPQEGEGDAISLLILSNRRVEACPEALCLHRPEKGRGGALTRTLARALLWARLSPGALRGAWFTGPWLAEEEGWNKACEENGVTFSLVTENIGIDLVSGYAGRASPWLAVTLADAAFAARGPQVIAAQPVADRDEVWVVVLTREEMRKE